jgi:hypothetical protein
VRLSWLVGLLALLLLGGSFTGVALAHQSSHQDPVAHSVHHGPPAWAHAHSKAASARAKGSKDWKGAWHAMTEAQRTARMETLSKAHAEGMRAWARCVEAAGEDRAGRSSCEKPLPPGLAKKQ